MMQMYSEACHGTSSELMPKELLLCLCFCLSSRFQRQLHIMSKLFGSCVTPICEACLNRNFEPDNQTCQGQPQQTW